MKLKRFKVQNAYRLDGRLDSMLGSFTVYVNVSNQVLWIKLMPFEISILRKKNLMLKKEPKLYFF